MKIKTMNLRQLFSRGNFCLKSVVIFKRPRFHIVALLGIGYFALTSSPATGAPTSHLSAAISHGKGYYRYLNPFWGSSYPGYADVYDSDYRYTPTPEQLTAAKKQVGKYLAAVKDGRKHAATHRYISVETLRPTRKQLEDYTGKMLPTQTVEPSQLCCVMVFDTQTKQFVGSGCYVVTGEPLAGAVEKFETVSAEFVGTRMF